jgi:hypothetical protein
MTATLEPLQSDLLELVKLVQRDELLLMAIMARGCRHTPPIPIRTFHAIHLVTARVAGATEVVATDKRMREAAKLLGFALVPH